MMEHTNTQLQTAAIWPQIANLFNALLRLTKPAVTLVLVFTAVMTAWAASGPWVDVSNLVVLAVAGGLMSAGAASLNQYLEQDIDARMPRTADRPLPSHQLVMPEVALAWGLFLCIASTIISLAMLPIQATFFITLGLAVYVLLYTLILKRSTSMNIVIGGFAGCCPILAGWAAVRADWPITPFAVAALVFFWTPVHFWAYALVHKESYRKAAIPMLPTELGAGPTVPHIIAHAIAMTLATALALKGIALIIGLVLSGAILFQCISLLRNHSSKRAYWLYKTSNYYLVAIFFIMAVTGALGG